MKGARLCAYRPALYAAAGVAAGVAAAFFLPAWAKAALVLFFAAAFFCAGVLKKGKRELALFCAAALAGTAAGELFLLGFPSGSFEGVVSGRITDATFCDEYGNAVLSGGNYLLELDSLSVDGRALAGRGSLILPASARADLKVGDYLYFYGAASGEEFSPESYQSLVAAKYRVYYSLQAFDAGALTRVDGSPSAVESMRLAIKGALYDNCREDTASFLFAMIFGDVAYMSDEVAQPFRDTGTAHLFAVSGLHVAILFYACARVLDKLKMPSPVRFCSGAAIMILYCALCSFSPSVVRSAVMIMAAELAKVLKTRYDALSSMGASCAAILLFAPYFLLDAGFLMSYAAVFGILGFYKPLFRALKKVLLKPLAEGIAVSVASNIGLLPLMLYYFGSVSLLTVPVNLVVVPLTSAFYPFLLLSALIAALIPPAGALLTLASVPTLAGVLFVQAGAQVSSAALNADFSPLLCVFYYPLLAIASVFSRFDKKIKAGALALCGALTAAACFFVLPV